MQRNIVKFDKKITIFQWSTSIYDFKTVKLGNIRFKLQQTLTKIVNRGSGNLIAIVL
jgi:hypothetical protein